jgi:pentatricopeptide repeat protein
MRRRLVLGGAALVVVTIGVGLVVRAHRQGPSRAESAGDQGESSAAGAGTFAPPSSMAAAQPRPPLKQQPCPSGPSGTGAVADQAPAAGATPESPVAWAARAYLDNEDYGEARDAATECLTDDPNDRSCWNTLLRGYTRTGQFELARPMLEECLAAEPDDLDCLDGMVTQHVRDGDLEAARRLAERMSRLAPDATSVYLALGQIADRSDDKAAAIQAYEGACSNGQEYACNRTEALRQGRR